MYNTYKLYQNALQKTNILATENLTTLCDNNNNIIILMCIEEILIRGGSSSLCITG